MPIPDLSYSSSSFGDALLNWKMKGLVDYGSDSDDEDSAAGLKAVSATANALPLNVNARQKGATNGVPASEANTANSAPMVGPSMPTNFDPEEDTTGQFDEDATSDPYLANLSEQDLVRQLTQASHPMTALPPSPPGSPDPTTEAKFKKFLELKARGLHFNEDLAKKPSFRNPALLGTLMSRAGIDGPAQYATSLPASVWDPSALPSYAYKEELMKSQQSIRDSEWARKQKESKIGKRTIDFAPASGSVPSSQHSTPGFRQKSGKS